MCAWGFAFPKLFILLEHRSHLEEFRQAEVPYCLCCSDESQSTRRSRQPGSQGPCLSLTLFGKMFSPGPGADITPHFPLASPDTWPIFHFKPNPCPSRCGPDTSGVQREGLNPDTGPDALIGGSKENHLLLFQPDRGHVSDSWFLGGHVPPPRPRVEDGQACSHPIARGLVSSNHV